MANDFGDLKNINQLPPDRLSFDRPLKDVLEHGGSVTATIVDDDGVAHTVTIDESKMRVSGQPLSEYIRDQAK